MDGNRLKHLEDVKRILLVAVDKEDAAGGFYEWSAKLAQDAECRALLRELAYTEKEHKLRLQKRLGIVLAEIDKIKHAGKHAA